MACLFYQQTGLEKRIPGCPSLSEPPSLPPCGAHQAQPPPSTISWVQGSPCSQTQQAALGVSSSQCCSTMLEMGKASLGMAHGTILRHRPAGMCRCPCLGSTLPAFEPIPLQRKCLQSLSTRPPYATTFQSCCFFLFQLLSCNTQYAQDE